jgi:hypothetical protein
MVPRLLSPETVGAVGIEPKPVLAAREQRGLSTLPVATLARDPGFMYSRTRLWIRSDDRARHSTAACPGLVSLRVGRSGSDECE